MTRLNMLRPCKPAEEQRINKSLAIRDGGYDAMICTKEWRHNRDDITMGVVWNGVMENFMGCRGPFPRVVSALGLPLHCSTTSCRYCSA